MIDDFLSDIKKINPEVNYNKTEINKFYNTDGTYGMNLQWRVHHYAQTKSAITELAQKQNLKPDVLFEEIMTKSKNRQRSLWSLQNEGLIPTYLKENQVIFDIAKSKYCPHIENDKIITPGENTFEELINTFSKEDGVVLAFAHPAYINSTMNNIKETKDLFEELIEKSQGLLQASESFHQAYNGKNIENTVSKINNFMQSKNLLNVGGRDNHSVNFILF